MTGVAASVGFCLERQDTQGRVGRASVTIHITLVGESVVVMDRTAWSRRSRVRGEFLDLEADIGSGDVANGYQLHWGMVGLPKYPQQSGVQV